MTPPNAPSNELLCLQTSALQGDADAQYQLGRCYTKGEGVEQDYAQAAYWARLAAEQGNATAQTLLAFFYERGKGVVRDDEQAIHWYRQAAAQGDDHAREALERYHDAYPLFFNTI